MRDDIDFGKTDVSVLFRKVLFPTVMGMVFSAIFVITDGIFVGKGVGSDALAAVNIVAPLFMISIATGLMFGVGASVVASIHLSQGKVKVASINITQGLVFSSLIMIIFSILCCIFRVQVAHIMGSSQALLPGVLEYLDSFAPFLTAFLILNAGMFYIRVDGSPNYAMACNVIPAIINIILDYIFIFVFNWGLTGAAIATGIGTVVGVAMILIYLWKFSTSLRLHKIKLSIKSMQLMARNIGYMAKLGTSAFISEVSIAVMMFIGNYVFIAHIGKDGVAAFSIVCYIFPIIFMVYNAIAQSAQPIISYNFGTYSKERIQKALMLSLKTALICGICFLAISTIFKHQIISLFLDETNNAYNIAIHGITYFASGYIFFALNIVSIGYFQGIESAKKATIITILRGCLFVPAGFLLLPPFLGVAGIWLAVPFAELLTLIYILSLQYGKVYKKTLRTA